MMETDIMVDSGMKLTCSRDELVHRLGIVARAVSTRTTVQILAGVLLQAETGALQLAATDMELSLRSSLDADVDGLPIELTDGPKYLLPQNADARWKALLK